MIVSIGKVAVPNRFDASLEGDAQVRGCSEN
jgi:hypothetical protein